MKKFMKGCGITALVLLVLGLIMAIVAGSMQGRKTISDIVNSVTGGKVQINLDGFKDFGIHIGEGIGDIVEGIGDGIHYDIDDNINMNFDNKYPIFSDVDNINEKFHGDDVKNLKIEAGGCEFKVLASEDEYFYLDGSKIGKMQCYVENGTLYIKSVLKTKGVFNSFNAAKLTLYVPANKTFDSLDVELGAGALELIPIEAKMVSLEVGAGEIIFSNLVTEDADMSVGMGSIVLKQFEAGKLNAEVGMGSLEASGDIRSNANLECAMGSIDLKLAGKETDFNYNFAGAMGSVTVGKSEYSGIAQERSVDNDAAKDLELECSMGSITVKFTE